MALKVFVVLIVISVFGYVTSPSEVVQIIVRIPFFFLQIWIRGLSGLKVRAGDPDADGHLEGRGEIERR